MVGLVADGHSVRLEYIVADYTVVVVLSYTVGVPPFAVELKITPMI